MAKGANEHKMMQFRASPQTQQALDYLQEELGCNNMTDTLQQVIRISKAFVEKQREAEKEGSSFVHLVTERELKKKDGPSKTSIITL